MDAGTAIEDTLARLREQDHDRICVTSGASRTGRMGPKLGDNQSRQTACAVWQLETMDGKTQLPIVPVLSLLQCQADRAC